MKISKITLGTAQLGMDYGIANIQGKLDYNKSIEILKYSWDHGISTFDTSPLYGNSEEIIGSFLSSNTNSDFKNFIIISKLPKVEVNGDVTFDSLYSIIKNQLKQSLEILHTEYFPIYLLHNPTDIFIIDGIVIECLNQLKKERLINRIGISIYNLEEAEASLKFREIDVIQLPINIFDHRLIKTGILKKLKDNNYTIFARSIYLQGLFFKLPEALPKNLENAKDLLLRLYKLSSEYNIDIAKLALLFIRDIPEIDSLIIGAEKVEQVADNLKIILEDPLDRDLRQQIYEEFSDISEKIINPSLWTK